MDTARHNLIRWFLTLLLVTLALPGAVGADGASPRYDERLPGTVARALKAAGIGQTGIAVVVQEAGTPVASVRVNAEKAFNPASLMKLLTTYAALELLGPAYTWKTEAWVRGNLNAGVLNGDLIIRGGGDPRLSFEQFWLLLREMRARGLRDIRGDLILDRGLFDTVGLNDTDGSASALIDDQPLSPYNVIPDPLLLNFKALRVGFVADVDNNTLLASIDPQPTNLEVINLVKAGNGACGNWKEGLRADLTPRRAGANARLVLTGSYPLACGARNWHLSVLPHPQYVEGVFRQLWRELGGSLAGELLEAALPADARQLAAIESPPLAEVVRDINKYSNNVMARQLFLAMGVQSRSASAPGDGVRNAHLADADSAIRGWLAQKQMRFPELIVENGSGLSRHSRIAAGSLARLLQLAWQSPVMPEFIASLPLSASDGTMRKRLRESGAAGRAHIKTGSLDGVKGIAGYVLDRAGKWQIVVFMINHPNAAAGQAAQDALLQWVYRRGEQES